MNWKIVEKSCDCILEYFLTWHDAISYFYNKRLDFQKYEIKAANVIDLKVRTHNILILSDLGKAEQYKDVLTVGEAAKKIRKSFFKIRFLKVKINHTEIIIKKPQGSDHHKTNLNDLINNWYKK